MKVTARIKGENQKLLDDLKAGNINCRLVRNALIVDLPLIGENIYGIPDLLQNQNVKYFIECTENVIFDDLKHKIAVTLICDKAGHAMRPYYLPKNAEEKEKDQAYFAVPFCFIIQANIHKDIIIKACSLESKESEIILTKKVIFSDTKKSLPNALSRFTKVVDKAFEKLDTISNTAFYAQIEVITENSKG